MLKKKNDGSRSTDTKGVGAFKITIPSYAGLRSVSVTTYPDAVRWSRSVNCENNRSVS